ncbi:unnamed protein product, partial [Citrullus colocynthis]
MNSTPPLEVLKVNPLAIVLWVDNKAFDTSIDQHAIRIDLVSSNVHSTCPKISDTIPNVLTAALANVMSDLLTNSLVVTFDKFFENVDECFVGASEASDALGLSVLALSLLWFVCPTLLSLMCIEEGTSHGSDPLTVESDNDDSTANLVSSTLIDVHSNNSDDDISITARGKSTN